MEIFLKLSICIISSLTLTLKKNNINKRSDKEDVLVILLSDSSTTSVCDSRAVFIDPEFK